MSWPAGGVGVIRLVGRARCRAPTRPAAGAARRRAECALGTAARPRTAARPAARRTDPGGRGSSARTGAAAHGADSHPTVRRRGRSRPGLVLVFDHRGALVGVAQPVDRGGDARPVGARPVVGGRRPRSDRRSRWRPCRGAPRGARARRRRRGWRRHGQQRPRPGRRAAPRRGRRRSGTATALAGRPAMCSARPAPGGSSRGRSLRPGSDASTATAAPRRSRRGSPGGRRTAAEAGAGVAPS